MSILKYNGTANPNASSANAKYITRERACDDLSFHNLPELENRADFLAYAERRKEEEAERPARGNGIQRNHHRLVLSWDRTETTDAAREQTQNFLKENFPNSRAAIAIHQDKQGQTHAHVWIDARGTDDRKLRLDKATYKSLDERWARDYDRTYGTDYARDYQQKKDETRQWKRDRVAGINRPKPTRARDGMTSDRWREKDIRDLGVERDEPNKRTDNRDQRFVAAGQRDSTVSVERNRTADRAIDSSVETIERAEQGTSSLDRIADETVRETEKLHSRFSEMGERSHSLEHDRDRDHSRGR
jgi:hypothetical protein